jgi:carbonic anhydrase/acetyltransferase-like protein (isoleucine patch superfamily)
MAEIITVRNFTPQIGTNVFLAKNATIVGDVKVGHNSSVWFQSVIRGDVSSITIGEDTNIQDGTVVHGTFEKHSTQIGNQVTIGHLCMLHGCTIGNLCLIGMGSILMDGAVISENSIVGAGSLVTENSKFPPGVLILGRPGKVIRNLNSDELAFLKKSADNYRLYSSWYK